MAKKTNQAPLYLETVLNEQLEEIMSDRYGRYAKTVIQDRAIPDVRDGLKPVQRRILYSMYDEGNLFTKPTRKCAHTVGAVMGKYHPHGDSSIYEALVRMSQTWKQNVPLIDFQGNNGSLDGDPAAAYRYTEARLAEIANELLRDIDKDTIDMQLTFDDTHLEPRVLPSRFPNLLVNGSEGIAVGVSTDIPPHNLKEVIEAIVYRIKNKKSEINAIRELILAPDFPTGGKIYKSEGLDNVYIKGEGRFEIEAKYEIIEGKTINQIIISEIPYSANKVGILVAIDKIKLAKDIDGIIEVRDETDMEGLRIVVDIKKEINNETIINYLLNKTDLRISYSPRMIAIVGGRPVQFTLLEYLDAYIEHQNEVLTRRTKFDLSKCQARLHIVDGLIKATSIIDEIIKLIRHSKDKQDSKTNLISRFQFSNEQAEAIVMMRLHTLSNTDVTMLLDEKKELEKSINDYQDILSNSKSLDKLLISDLESIKKKYGVDRRTEILESRETVSINLKDLILKEDVWVSISSLGYIKRSSFKSYDASTGLTGLKDGDSLIGNLVANTADVILCFTKLGYFLYIPVNIIKETKWKEVGENIRSQIFMIENDRIIRCLLVKKFRDDLFITSITRNGMIKKTILSEFEMIKYSRPSRYIRLSNDDDVVDVNLTNGGNDLTLLTDDGEGAYIAEEDVNDTGLMASGIYGIKLTNHNYLVSLLVSNRDERMKYLAITDHGALRVCDLNHIQKTSRLGRKQVIFKTFKSIPHHLIGTIPLIKKEDQLSFYVLLDNEQNQEVTLTDLSVTPYESYVKKDDIGLKGHKIVRLFIKDVQVVDANTKSLFRKDRPKNPIPQTEKKDYEQISILDILFDENE